MPTKSKIWSLNEIEAIYQQPFNDLLFQAHTVHKQHFNPNEVQVASLLSVQTGTCPEDCQYCPQSLRYTTDVEPQKMLPMSAVIEAAKKAKASGANRFCMGAAVRQPTNKHIDTMIEMIEAVNEMGLESCLTTGMLTKEKASRLKEANLDYYNHNLDTSPEFYDSIISTRTYQERLDTLSNLKEVGIKVCCGGILGMGESIPDRFSFLQQLANLDPYPESVPINQLIPTKGTPLEDQEKVDAIEFVRIIATSRILMPKASIRLSGWRSALSEETQALCFFAGANSLFIGETLLTRKNCLPEADEAMFSKLGLIAQGLLKAPKPIKEKQNSHHLDIMTLS